jgi:lysophospholipase L1-like esterase
MGLGMKKRIIKLLICLSVLLNILVVTAVILATTGKLVPLLAPLITTTMGPKYERLVSQYEGFTLQSGDVVFLGDSITQGGSWHELFPNRPVRNRGIGGDTTKGILNRLHQVTNGKPSQVFLLIGTNDVSLGETDETIIANIVSILEQITDESPQTQVFVQTLLPRGASYQERIETLNIKIRSAIGDRAEWIDLYSLLLAEDGSIADRYSNDELHLMGAGYEVWKKAISSLVRVP